MAALEIIITPAPIRAVYRVLGTELRALHGLPHLYLPLLHKLSVIPLILQIKKTSLEKLNNFPKTTELLKW